ncbi:MAG: alpha-1,4-digalacturonate transport system permease protein [Glaciecola sp.]|jgi:alpha-1,4-digalacturonate transport system permease protein
MAIVRGTKRRRVMGTAGIYLLLTAVATAMLFPFLFVVGSSVKSRTDIFTYPPRVLPREQQTVVVGGQPVSAFTIDGQVRGLVGEVRVGTYEYLDEPGRTTQLPRADLSPHPDARTVPYGGDTADVLIATIDGREVEVVEVSRTVLAVFADPANPDDVVLANERTAAAVEKVDPRTENFSEVLELQTLDRSLTNTALVTLLVVLGTVVTSILGGYAFARIDFPGRDAMFLVYLGSIMVPFVILIIPLYQLMVALGWVDSLAALVFPFFFNAYGTFLIRQFFVTIPYELEEAAVVDGASRWTILWRIYVPLAAPAIATLSTFMFLHAWNSFVWPFVVINAGNTDNHVLTLSLQVLGGRAADTPNLIYAGVMIAIAVPVTVFILAQRYFVENVATSGLK